MRIVIEIEGGEVSVAAQPSGATTTTGAAEMMPAQAIAGAAMDAGSAPAGMGGVVSSMVQTGPEVAAAVMAAVATQVEAMDAGVAPLASEMIEAAPGQLAKPAADLAAAPMAGGEAIDAGAAKFTPPADTGKGGA